MKTFTFLISGFLALLVVSSCTKPNRPYEVVDGYMFVQKEERRNDNTDWELVWEDEFNKGTLDTSHWTL